VGLESAAIVVHPATPILGGWGRLLQSGTPAATAVDPMSTEVDSVSTFHIREMPNGACGQPGDTKCTCANLSSADEPLLGSNWIESH